MDKRFASPWDWGYGPYGSRSGYRYDPYNRYGYRNGYGGYGYPGYGYGGGVIIVRGGSDATPAPHGRMVKGRGYERGATPTPSNSERASPRDRSAASSERSGGSSGSSSGSSSGGSSSSGSGSSSSDSSERTAKPRP